MIDNDQFTRFGTVNAKFFIKKTNETGENTYHLLDSIGEVYNLPAYPTEFILQDINGVEYTSANGDELIINSKKLKPLADFFDTKADIDASNIDGENVILWREALRIVGDSASLSTKAETDASNIDSHIHIWRQKIDANYVHDQAQPVNIWTINHPLNKKVSVTITDTAGTVVEGQVTINDGNKVVIEFNFPFSGEAILN